HLTSPDGKESDSIALASKGNGEYEAVLDDVPSKANGFWSVRYDATGVNDHGVEFARTGSNQFMNERPTARLGMINSKRDGDTLHVSVNARVLESGRYRLDVIVASRDDRRGIAWGESELTLEPG